jgi:hypothetical protein
MRKALVVGIDHYENIGDLFGCVSDAHAVKNVLERHRGRDGTVNFAVRLLSSGGPRAAITRAEIKETCRSCSRMTPRSRCSISRDMAMWR